MDLNATLLKLNEKDRLMLRIEHLDTEKYALQKVDEADLEADIEVKYVNGIKRLVWSLVGLFIILYALFLDRRFENVDFWNGFFVIGMIVFCVYGSIVLIQHYRGKSILTTRAKMKVRSKEMESRKEEAERTALSYKARMKEIRQEQLQLKATIKLIDKQLEDSIVPLEYRQASTIKHFKKNIDSLRAKSLRDAIRIYNEEKKRQERIDII